MLVLLSYIWCDEYWMAAYNVPDYTGGGQRHTPHRPFSFRFYCSWRRPDRRSGSLPKICIRRGGRLSVVFYLSRLRFHYSIGWLFSHRTTIHKLARIQLHVFSASADQLALGSHARIALWLVEISQGYSRWAAHRSVVRSAN